MSLPKTIGDPSKPSAPSPAPAQTVELMMIIFGTPVVSQLHDNGDIVYDIGLDTSTNLPNVLVVHKLKKWYTNGVLHRKGIHPSLKADYVGAMWKTQNDNTVYPSTGVGTNNRIGGPHTIGIQNYKEFYDEGTFQGYRHGDIYEVWSDKLKNVHNDITGPTNPLSTEYCMDIQDRLMVHALG
jgi:hypothetical protein